MITPEQNKEQLRKKANERSRAWYWKNKEKVRRRHRAYRVAHRELFVKAMKVYRQKHRARLLKASKEKYARARKDLFEAYGNRCACCLETRFEFLTIDHINGDGALHRRMLYGKNVGSVDHDLKRRGYPPGYQILCYNCNMSKAHRKYCPHEREYEHLKVLQ